MEGCTPRLCECDKRRPGRKNERAIEQRREGDVARKEEESKGLAVVAILEERRGAEKAQWEKEKARVLRQARINRGREECRENCMQP